MTDFEDVLVDSGSGFVAYRLEIEGWPHQWVTDPRITNGASFIPRKVYAGLSYEGLRISEQIVLRDAWPEVEGITAKIVPTDSNEDTLLGFTYDPNVVATLIDPVPADGIGWNTRPVLPDDAVYHLAGEAVYQTGGLTLEGKEITRGFWNTEAQEHGTLDGSAENTVPIYDWPPTMEGRRAYLAAYGPTDDPDSDGHIIWRGVVLRPPALDHDGVTWGIEIGPITTRFDQTVGAADETEYKIRGVYHSEDSPMRISFWTNDDGTLEIAPIELHGFYETQEAWAAHVNLALATAVSGATGNAAHVTSITFTYDAPKGKYSFFVQLDSAQDDWPFIIYVEDVLDGGLDAGSPGDPRPNGNPVFSGATHIFAGDIGDVFLANGHARPPWAYPLPAARTVVGRPYTEDHDPTLDKFYTSYPISDPDAPSSRVYLQKVDGLEIDDTLVVKNGDDARFMRITAVDSVARSIDVTVLGSTISGIFIGSDSVIVPVRVYSEDGNWADFIQGVVNQAPATANLGKSPWITDRDVNTSDWPELWETYPFHAFWRHRSYRFIKQVRVRDVFAPELAATGWMARLDADGRINVAQMPVVSPSRSADWALTDDEILLPADGMFGMWPHWQAQTDGLVNILKLQTAYNPVTDDFAPSGDYTVRMTQSIAEHKSGSRASATMEIRSESVAYAVPYATGTEISGLTLHIIRSRTAVLTSDLVVDFVMPYLRTLSRDYAIVTVAVPFTMFGVLVGDIVEVTSEFIPDRLGGRGVDAKNAICVGREWELDPASGGMGKLTLWMPRDGSRVSGYSPTARVSGETDLGGDSWRLLVANTNRFNQAWRENDAVTVTKHFRVDDSIKLVQTDTLTPVVIQGVITAIPDTSHIEVQLETTWDPGIGGRWNLRFNFVTDEYDSPPTERQARYCWVADQDGLYLRGEFPAYPTAREFV